MSNYTLKAYLLQSFYPLKNPFSLPFVADPVENGRLHKDSKDASDGPETVIHLFW